MTHQPTDPATRLPAITICGVSELDDEARCGRHTHVVSIWGKDEGESVSRLVAGLFPHASLHLAFFDDISMETPYGPSEQDIRMILEFGKRLGPQDRLLVHCLAGVSRSSACAFSLACQCTDPGDAARVLALLRANRPFIMPNTLIVRYADALLGRGQRMVEAVNRSRMEQWMP